MVYPYPASKYDQQMGFLLPRWRSILHKISDKDCEQVAEGQCLTAVLGMAIGHTRRLCARFTNEAMGIHLYRNEISHVTRLVLRHGSTKKAYKPPTTSTQAT